MTTALSPALTPTLITTLTLPGYCNHVHELHDGQTRWLLADAEIGGRSTVQLYRLNYYKDPDEWELCWDLTRDEVWNQNHKPGLGHSLALGPKSLIVSVTWKDLSGGAPGVTSYSFLRDAIPPMQG